MTDSLKTKPIVLVTGANGMVAKKLVEFLSDSYTFRFLTRKATSPNQFEWDIPNKKHLKEFNISFTWLERILVTVDGLKNKRETSYQVELKALS